MIKALTTLLIFAVLPCTHSQTHQNQLAEIWLDGYMSEFRDQVHFVYNEAPTKIEIDIFTNGRKKTKILKLVDQDTVTQILDSIDLSVSQLASELNTFNEDGERVRARISFKPQYKSFLRIEWMKSSYRVVLGMEPGALSYTIYEMKRKEPLLVSRKLCHFDLFEETKKLLQPDGGHNSGSSAASIVTP